MFLNTNSRKSKEQWKQLSYEIHKYSLCSVIIIENAAFSVFSPENFLPPHLYLSETQNKGISSPTNSLVFSKNRGEHKFKTNFFTIWPQLVNLGCHRRLFLGWIFGFFTQYRFWVLSALWTNCSGLVSLLLCNVYQNVYDTAIALSWGLTHRHITLWYCLSPLLL